MARSRTTFRKGQPAINPGGRPKTVTQVQELAKKQTERAIQVLTDAMENATKLYGMQLKAHPDYRVKVAAAEALLSRGWGSPARAEERPADDATKAHLLALQAEKLQAETALLKQKLLEGERENGSPDPASDDEVDQMMRERFGGVQHYGADPNAEPQEH